MKNNSVIVICGDPKSTFSEIFVKTFKTKFFKQIKFPIILICSEILLKREFKKFKTKINLSKFKDLNELENNKIYYIDIPLDQKKLTKTKINLYIKRSFQAGLNLLKKKKSLALINGPISKSNFLKGKYFGITEYLADKTKSSSKVMIIFNEKLSVSPVTTHVQINDVTRKINKGKIV